MKDDLIKIFIEEVNDLLQELEASLLELGNNQSDKELLNKAFRSLHTIKGAAGMYGYNEISNFTHGMETIFDNLRNDKIELSNEILTSTLNACDIIHELIADAEIKISDVAEGEAIFNFFANYQGTTNSHENKIVKIKPETNNAKEEKLFYIKFVPHLDFLSNGSNPLFLIEELKDLGDLFIVSHTENIPGIENIEPESCYLAWELILHTSKEINAIKDVFIFAEDSADLKYTEVNAKLNVNTKELFEQIKNKIEKLKIKDFESVPAIIAELTTVEKSRQVKSINKHSEVNPVVKVKSEKLDKLVNLVGELVTVQAGLSQNVKENTFAGLEQIAEEIERITWELRDNTLNLRMVPFNTLSNKLQRLVRDLSLELGKDIEFEINGGETELDKGMVEKLNDPLMHIIRNSVDHGIELPEERIKNNKFPKGKITLSAIHSGDSVLIKITDDGKGLNKNKILDKAVKNKLVGKNEDLSDAEIINLIFAPGFSTAENVTNVSGRGVGMDVVKRTIEELGGRVSLASTENQGCELRLILPLTMAIIEGLLVKIGCNYFVLPLKTVEEVVEITNEKINSSNNHSLISVRNSFVPYIKLRERFFINGDLPEIQQIVIVSDSEERVGLLVDNVIGQHQSVIKSLGKEYKNIEEVSGGTILGDGTMALILNTNKFLTECEK